MRRWSIVVVAASACGFQPSGEIARDAAPARPDAGSAMPIDAAMQDAPVGGPACLHDTAYIAGGPETTHRYRLVATALDRDTAFDACAADGAHLVVIGGSAENAFVATLAATQAQAPWIGYADLVTEATFAWIAPLTSSFAPPWAPTQPDDGGSDGQAEDCVVMLGATGLWNDTSCGDARPAVCECEDGYVAPPKKLCRTQAGWTTFAGRRYQAVKAPSGSGSWALDEAACERSDATLFVPSDADEIAYATGPTGLATSSSIWIGDYNDANGSQTWIDGSPVVFQNYSGTPSKNTTDCTEQGSDGGPWTTHGCTDNHDYVCECDPDPPRPPPNPPPTHGS